MALISHHPIIAELSVHLGPLIDVMLSCGLTMMFSPGCGVGPKGAVALAGGLRVNKGLEELNLGSEELCSATAMCCHPNYVVLFSSSSSMTRNNSTWPNKCFIVVMF
jgi:hypothetical protein